MCFEERTMSREAELREQIATLTRIFAMRGLLGLHGHISAYDPDADRMYICPGFGWDKATTRPEDLFVFNVAGDVLEGQGRRLPLEWPIHTALHAARPDVLAVGHLHSPFATAFAVTRAEFRPVMISGALFASGVPTYQERHLITTPERGRAVAELIGAGRAALLRSHGTVVAAADVEELLLASLLLEDNARAAVEAASLGELDYLEPEQSAMAEADARISDRARLAWRYFAQLEARWDRQPPPGGPLG
jgi:ribulose-5-phosphate 4-epimerase/fuculose-1-phosphate aldolase